jgi:SAM-dependent methyltransferase
VVDWTESFEDHDWATYYEQVADREPRQLLLDALALVDEHGPARTGGRPRTAVDLGAGAGTEVLALLRVGWRVHAVDLTPQSIERVRARAQEAGLSERLTTSVRAFEDVRELPPAELVHSSFSLSYCPPQAFDATWEVVTEAVVPGGWLAVTLFGDRDDFAGNVTVTTLAEGDVRARLDGWDLHRWDVVDEDGVTAAGEAKRWHVMTVVARRG